MEIEKALLGMFGEYFVAAQLCRRGWWAQVTMGNRKKTDIICDNDQRLFRVSVKTKQKRDWPSVKGISEDNDILILLDMQGSLNFEPKVYILTTDDWKKICKRKKKKSSYWQFDDYNVPYYYNEDGSRSKGGATVSLGEVREFEDAWHVFEQ